MREPDVAAAARMPEGALDDPAAKRQRLVGQPVEVQPPVRPILAGQRRPALRRPLRQQGVVFRREVGQAPQGADDTGRQGGLEDRQHTVANAVPRESRVLVGRVLAAGERPVREIPSDLVALGAEQWSHEAPGPGSDAAQPTKTGSPGDVHEDRLGLIAGRVAGRDQGAAQVRPCALVELLAGVVAGGFDGTPAASGQGRDVRVTDAGGQAGALCFGPAERLVPVGLVAPEAMVQVRDPRHSRTKRRRALQEQVKQRDGVGAAGQRDDEAIPRRHQGARPDEPGHPRGEGGHGGFDESPAGASLSAYGLQPTGTSCSSSSSPRGNPGPPARAPFAGMSSTGSLRD